jgi:hypothetical protein
MGIMTPKVKRALRKSFWASLGRLLGIVMASGAGSVIIQTIGQQSNWALPLGIGMAIIGFSLMWAAEYRHERE